MTMTPRFSGARRIHVRQGIPRTFTYTSVSSLQTEMSSIRLNEISAREDPELHEAVDVSIAFRPEERVRPEERERPDAPDKVPGEVQHRDVHAVLHALQVRDLEIGEIELALEARQIVIVDAEIEVAEEEAVHRLDESIPLGALRLVAIFPVLMYGLFLLVELRFFGVPEIVALERELFLVLEIFTMIDAGRPDFGEIDLRISTRRRHFRRRASIQSHAG